MANWHSTFVISYVEQMIRTFTCTFIWFTWRQQAYMLILTGIRLAGIWNCKTIQTTRQWFPSESHICSSSHSHGTLTFWILTQWMQNEQIRCTLKAFNQHFALAVPKFIDPINGLIDQCNVQWVFKHLNSFRHCWRKKKKGRKFRQLCSMHSSAYFLWHLLRFLNSVMMWRLRPLSKTVSIVPLRWSAQYKRCAEWSIVRPVAHSMPRSRSACLSVPSIDADKMPLSNVDQKIFRELGSTTMSIGWIPDGTIVTNWSPFKSVETTWWCLASKM